MLAPTGKLRLQTHIIITFSNDILCVLQAQVETAGSYYTTTHQTTTLLPRMLHSTSQALEKSYSLRATIPCLHHCLVNCVQVHVRKAYYTGKDHYITKDVFFLQVEMNYDF